MLVNNAANDERHAVGDARAWREWDDRLQVNLRHHFFATQAVAPMMRAAGRRLGRQPGLDRRPHRPAWTCRSTSPRRPGIEGLTRTLARELGPDGIRVNCVLPGWVMTERQLTHWVTPEAEASIERNQCLPHKLYPDDVARLVLWLAADDSRVLHRAEVGRDGGWT